MNRAMQHSSGRHRSPSDPLALALQPPPNETPAQREGRLRAEQEAKKRSDNIDKMLRDSERRTRRRKTIKVLLLGQSESGKSTTLKQFQLLHTPAAFREERLAWRFVIYLNLLRSVRRILDAISPEQDAVVNGFDEVEDYENTEPAPIIISSSNGHSSSAAPTNAAPNYDRYVRKLGPLFELEQKLILQLADPEDNADHEPTHLPAEQSLWYQQPATAWSTSAINLGSYEIAGPKRSVAAPSSSRTQRTPPVSPTSLSHGEPTVSTTSNWKQMLSLGRIAKVKNEESGELQGWWEDPEDPVHILNYCAPYITQLWKDPKVRQKLADKKLRLEESSGFYLDEIDRITAKMYFPTDDDVLKARLKTTGVIEHTFTLDQPEFRGVHWKIYDVGGARQQRQAWAPYFDDVDAIIFLAPISAFDQVLAEDPNVNRLQDSLVLWKWVVNNKLLANVNIILFLNKCDLLKKKLESGVKLKHHMHGYRDRPNDYETVSKYFYNKFGAIHQGYTQNKARELYIHLTSVTNTQSTHTIIMNVRDIILQTNLRSTALI